jgi:UPF0755 protein
MPSGNSQRTAEDRERARLERERRRQGARGGQPTDDGANANGDRSGADGDRSTPRQTLEAEAIAPASPPTEVPEAVPPREVPAAETSVALPAESQGTQLPVAVLPERKPPRIAGTAPLPSKRAGKHWPARVRVGALLVLVLVVCGGLLAFVLGRDSKKSKPTAAIAVVTITIPEGETRAQIAQIASAKGLRGSYLKATRHSSALNSRRYGAPRTTHTLEGFLFPATYELYAGAPVSQLVADQLSAFGENFGSEQALRAHALHVTPYQLLIVASMVEREAFLNRDRPRVAAVIYNRMGIGMPLGIDSTIRYALHDYTKPLTEAQLQIDSPYNTRTHHGLPPTPISNPGLASIDAAAHPAHVGYLYYVNGADGCGDLVFSTGNAQFERDAAAYREALARHGGRVPSCRKH